MIVGFSKHGRGQAAGAIGYLVAEKTRTGPTDYVLGKTNRAGVLRQPAPVVLRGDVRLTQRLIDGSPHRWKYTSGVLSFAERITPEIEKNIMDEFERTAFAGLTLDRY